MTQQNELGEGVASSQSMTTWAFVDESGDPNLNIETGASRHYSVAAVLAREGELERLRGAVEQIRKQYFNQGVIKSKSVKKSLEKRVQVLEALALAGVKFVGLVIDKQALDNASGVRFKESFIKFFHAFLYEKIYRANPSTHVRADNYGREEFREGFRKYVKTKFRQVDLFDRAPTTEFVEDQTEVLVQAADFLAGTIRIAYDEPRDETAAALIAHLRPMSLGWHVWPLSKRSREPVTHQPELDAVVRTIAVESATRFVDEHSEAFDETIRLQVEVLQELAFRAQWDGSHFVSGDELADLMRARGFVGCKKETIRRAAVASLRDSAVLIVSSDRGYALPKCAADVEVHLRRMQDEVIPIINRVSTFRNAVKRVTHGHDLLEMPALADLRTVTEATEDAALRKRET